MAKKNSRSEHSAFPTPGPVPERRRTARATTRSMARTPDAAIAEPDGSPAVVLDMANDLTRPGDSGTSTYTPSYEEIAEAAYLRYLGRGGHHGHDFDDWLDAERSLRVRN